MKFFLFFLFFNFFSEAQTIEDDFEGNGTISTWFGDDCNIDTSFSNPFQIGLNTSGTVLRYSDVGGAYSNVRFDVPINFNLSEYFTFSIKIYVPSNSITGTEVNQVSLKLQDGKIGAAWSTQSEIVKPIILNEWQTITFDFKNDDYKNLNLNSIEPTLRKDFNRVLLQINGENNTSNVIAYIDDFLYDGMLIHDNSSYTDPVFDNLVWSDEFNGTGALDTDKWFHQTQPIINGIEWANGEIQHYTDKETNSFMADGALKIVAKKETYTSLGVTKNYTSARLNSKFAFTYGKVEIKAKMPFGVGTFPALWMLGKNITETGGYWAATHGTKGWPDCGEVDIIEHWGSNQNFVQSAMHNRSSFGGTVNKGGRIITNASTEFHIYALEWNSDKMIFSVDGIVHYIYNPANKNIQNWPYDAPQYLLFNVAVLPNVTSGFTQTAMEVDYVRVYQESTASVLNNSFSNEINIYPNPVKGVFTIQRAKNIENLKCEIYDIAGKKIEVIIQKSPKVTHDISHLKSGIYILKIETSIEINYYKILKE